MAQLVNTLGNKPEDLSLIPRIHMEEGQSPQTRVLWPHKFRGMHAYACVYAHRKLINVMKSTLTVKWKNKSNHGKTRRKKLQLFWEETLTSSTVTGETTARRKANGLVHRSISIGRGESQSQLLLSARHS